jgi:hypothetical protein
MENKQNSIPKHIPRIILIAVFTAFLTVAVFTACGRTPGVSPGSTTRVTNPGSESQASGSQASESQASESLSSSDNPSDNPSESQPSEPQTTIPQTDTTAPVPSESSTVSPTAEPSPAPVASMQKSQPGTILDETVDKALLVRLLMMEDYSLKGFQAGFGKEYAESEDGEYKLYSFPNGVYFDLRNDGTVAEFGVNNGNIILYPEQIQRMEADIFGNPGNEWLILYECDLYYRLLVLDGATQSVLREYETGFLNLSDAEIGDFLRDGSLQLYLDGYGDGTEKREIYRAVADDFVRVYDLGSFSNYADGIKAVITGSQLALDVQLEGYSAQKQSRLPERLYYDNLDIADKNTLLAVHPSWHLLEKGGQWFVTVRNSVDFNMLGYYWGPPVENPEKNGMMLNDLARVDLVLAIENGAPKIVDFNAIVKYDNPALLSIKPVGREEGQLLKGPVLESTMEEAFVAAGGDIKTFEYAEQLTVNGVSLFEFTGSIVDITVTGTRHSTTRGMKVGDSMQTVERLYGKPDVGFSGDETVSYKCTNDYLGKPQVNYYRGMDVSYKNGVVKSFTLYQVILD